MKILSLFHINNYIMSGHTINRASWEIPNTQYSSLVLKKKNWDFWNERSYYAYLTVLVCANNKRGHRWLDIKYIKIVIIKIPSCSYRTT